MIGKILKLLGILLIVLITSGKISGEFILYSIFAIGAIVIIFDNDDNGNGKKNY